MKIINSDKDKFLIMKYQGPPKLKYYIDNVSLTRIENNDDKYKTKTYDTLNIGDKIILHHIYFDFDKFEIRTTSFDELNRVYRFMNKNENIRILISGYTDNFGSDVYNDTLSYNRACAVMSYLENKGISCDRISVNGYGEKYPIDSNNTSAGRQNNRRIEMQIIQK
jgi:outer membrane protein OmpA-like peptidoglycan-associated protein